MDGVNAVYRTFGAETLNAAYEILFRKFKPVLKALRGSDLAYKIRELPVNHT